MIKEFKNKNINFKLDKGVYNFEEEKEYFLNEELFMKDFYFLPCSSSGTPLLVNYRLNTFYDISLWYIKENLSYNKVIKISPFCSLEKAISEGYLISDEEEAI